MAQANLPQPTEKNTGEMKMPVSILNRSARIITLATNNGNGVKDGAYATKHRMEVNSVCTFTDAQWAQLKDNPVVKAYLKSEDLRKVSKDPEDKELSEKVAAAEKASAAAAAEKAAADKLEAEKLAAAEAAAKGK